MAASIASGVASNVIAKLLEYAAKGAISQIAPYFGGTHKLKQLEQTMKMIQARLVDAERRGEGDNEQVVKKWLQRLKRVLYRLEDLLEEVAMANTEKEQMPGGNLTKPVQLLLSDSSPLKINKKVAQEAKAIMEEMETLTSVLNGLNFRELPMKECSVVHVDNSRETHSFVIEEEVIGRDEDKKKIIAKLLNSDNMRENVSVIPIVGIGGLGKTTLAQLVFSDEHVRKHFELKCWVCISETSSLNELAGKILTSISGVDNRQLKLEQIQARLREAVNGKKYLLVFDDIWDEDRKRWLDLRSLLQGGKQGSKILVTSRSRVVARNMGTVESYDLKGLPEDKSWDLFKRLAFKEGQEVENPSLVRIGREIVKSCANVPLAIKTIACLLYSMDTKIEWEAFKVKDLAMVEHNENSILSTLKLSYNRLPSQLKQCFAYCSLFPKGHVFLKRDLIYLWMAQGFVGSSSGHQSLEDVGHGYFMQLMSRSFFQDADFDEDGEMISCKIHDLMHDLAQLAAGGETLLIAGPTQQISDNIWHVSFCSELAKPPLWLLATKEMRSFLHQHHNNTWLKCGELFPSLRCLRALHLKNSRSLPDSLGELKHLRYLKLGGWLESLPECTTRLQNLQTLHLRDCDRLKELPKGLSKLINLRHLHFRSDPCIDDMPARFGQLTSLCALDSFVVGESNGLDALATLNHLAGLLTIRFKNRRDNAISEATPGILKDTVLTDLILVWYGVSGADELDTDELALRCLLPPPSLRSLKVYSYKGVSFPRWGMDEFPCLLPNLVRVEITGCTRCQHLPLLSRLPRLKSLVLGCLSALEHIEIGGDNSEASYAEYFPSLQSLKLQKLPELKSWSEEEIDTIHPQRPNVENHPSLLPGSFFPHLSDLIIENCPKLELMPLAPRLVSLKATDIHGKLIKHLLLAAQGWESLTTSSPQPFSSCLPKTFREICRKLKSMPLPSRPASLQAKPIQGELQHLLGAEQELESISRSPTTSSLHLSYLSTLQSVDIRSVHELDSLLINLCSLETLTINKCQDLLTLSARSPTSLRQLNITRCARLVDISGALQHLTVLDELVIRDCKEVDLGYVNDGRLKSLRSLVLFNMSIPVIPLRRLGCLSRLQELKIIQLYNLTALPKHIECLTLLQDLHISRIKYLISLPQSIGSLVQLQKLYIGDCSNLTALPESVGNLTVLKRLEISDCPKLEALPKSFGNLTSLQSLEIKGEELKKRCEKPYGQDWPLIQHIPHVLLYR